MHSRRPPVAFGLLLLLPCLMLLTVAPALTDLPAGRVPHLKLKLPANKVTRQLLHLDGPCKCRQICFAITCFCYTLVKTDAGTLDCYFSKDDVRKTNMIADTKATTVCYSDYLPFGERFYRIYPAMTPYAGITRCNADNGRIAILDTEGKKQELINAMKRAGVDEVWTALFFYSNEKKGRWHGAGGGNAYAVDIVLSGTETWGIDGILFLSLALTGTGPAFLNKNPYGSLPIACQRDY